MARQQALVIGLGHFGMALARALAEGGVEVLAVDIDMQRVQEASGFATEAIAMDAMVEDELARLRPGSRDLCVCAIGDESREASIIVTAMMRHMGAKRLVARATDAVHERILELVGAHEVIHPERIVGERLAARLSARGLVDILPLGDGLELSEIEVPGAAVGRTLEELRLPDRHALTVLAVRRPTSGEPRVLLPRRDVELHAGDVLVVVGEPGSAKTYVVGS